MVETSYGLRKFIQILTENKRQNLYVNIGGINAFNNINKILKSKDFKKLKGLVIGRSDLAGSLNLEKSEVDSKRIFKLVKNLLRKIKKNKKIVTKMGGSLTPNSLDFVSRLFKDNLLNSVETRNIEIKLSNKVLKNFKKIIVKIFKFELEWIKYNQKRNLKSKNKIKNDSVSRIKEIKKRIKNFSNA